MLRRPVGGPAVMRAQPDRLVEVLRMPRVSVRVMPYRPAEPVARTRDILGELRKEL